MRETLLLRNARRGDSGASWPGTNASFTLSRTNYTETAAATAGSLTGSGFATYTFATPQPLVLAVDGAAVTISVSMTGAVATAADVVALLNADATFAAAAVAAVDGTNVKITSLATGAGSAVAIDASSGADAKLLFGAAPVAAAGAGFLQITSLTTGVGSSVALDGAASGANAALLLGSAAPAATAGLPDRNEQLVVQVGSPHMFPTFLRCSHSPVPRQRLPARHF